MAALTTQQVVLAGLEPTFGAAAGGGDTAAPGDTNFLVVKNGDAAPHTVTLATPGTLATGDAYPDKTVSVPAGEERWIGPLSAPIFRNPSTGRVAITYDGATSVTVAVIKI